MSGHESLPAPRDLIGVVAGLAVTAGAALLVIAGFATGHPPRSIGWVVGGAALAIGVATFVLARMRGRAVPRGVTMGPLWAAVYVVVTLGGATLLTLTDKDPTIGLLIAALGAWRVAASVQQEPARERRNRVHAQQEAPRRAP